MILSILVALSTRAATPTNPTPPAAPDAVAIRSQLDEAQRAAVAGRLDQARLMISRAIAAGADQREADRAVADLAFKSNKYPDALALYQQLLLQAPTDA